MALLCYPAPHEYNMAHWAFRRLSGMLAREGIHVMRFDWSGTGDSWGNAADGTFERWLDDIVVASQELRDIAGASSLTVIGMRLGATVAASACAKGLAIDTLVLWEPVVSGRAYLADLEELDVRENTTLLHAAPDKGRSRLELVGFPFPTQLRRVLEDTDLHRFLPMSAGRVAIVASTDRAEYRLLCGAMTAARLQAEYHSTIEDQSVTNAGQREAALLSSRSLIAIRNHVLGRV